MKNKIIIGIDEAGRGALAGPVYAACCCIGENCNLSLLNDSKKLSEKKRNTARDNIISTSIYGIGFATHSEIDETNILQATFLAMERAYKNFLRNAEDKKIILEDAQIIVDGSLLPPFLEKYNSDNLFNESSITASALIKADSRIPAVMAASILAKTSRDRIMYFADKKWPQYFFKKHKGYGTELHRSMIKKYGPSYIARRTFEIKE